MKNNVKHAVVESMTDTLIATVYSVPVNYILAFIAVKYSWTPLEITIYFTSIFFIIAVYRKTKIRLYFESRRQNETSS